jgi:glycosyltransferase involved in cell wall biosynthesis
LRIKALVIAPQPFFSPRGTPFSVYYRTLVSSQMGVDVDFLTYGDGQDVDIPGTRIFRIPRFAFLGPIKVGPSLPKLFLDMFMVLWTVALLLRNRYAFVHAHEEAVFFCRFLKPIFRFKLIYDMHSSLPQQLTNFQFTTSKLLIGIFKLLEDTSLRAADAVITICPDLADYVNAMLRDRSKHVLIENSIFEPVRLALKPTSVERDLPDGDQGQPLSPIALPKGKRFVVYAGTLEPYQGIDILLRAFGHVLEKTTDAELIIVGGNQGQVDEYRGLAQSLGIETAVHFTGRVPQALAKHYSGLASVLVSARSEGTNTPLKVYEQIASGIPLVATAIYSHTQVLDNRVAFLVKPEPKKMAAGLLAALDPDGIGNEIAENARQLYQEKYSRPMYEKKMRKVFGVLNLCVE